jgi:hypothetical protein
MPAPIILTPAMALDIYMFKLASSDSTCYKDKLTGFKNLRGG